MDYAAVDSPMSHMGHERRFRDVRGESGLPPTPEGLRQRSEPTLSAPRPRPNIAGQGNFAHYGHTERVKA